MYGHVYELAKHEAKGVEEAGGEARLFQVAETLPQEVLTKMHAPAKPDVPIINPSELCDADGILFGIPTRFGTTPSQIRALFDACGQIWQTGGLVNKPGGIFFSTATQGGGQETTALTTTTFLAHQGMMFVPLGYRNPALFNMDEVHGGSPWGAGTLAGPTGARKISELEANIAVSQGKSFTELVATLKLGKAAASKK
jgi:NAD(P)H dehydrogenase (quinone)